ncbi:MAG: peptide chain release factor N(5)-glutamine methyltransferase [Flavobacteriales bacterium]
MFVKENTVQAIKDYFFDSLEEIYPIHEVESFFYILAEHFIALSRVQIKLEPKKTMSESELLKFHYAIKELKKNKPVQFITGKQFFYDNEFCVTEHTLIPRPETEELVDLILKDNSDCKGSILDIGTGTGAIAISLDLILREADVTAFDVSEQALKIAEKNNADLQANVDFQFQDILNPNYSGRKFDVIVSNPPYVLESEKESMHANVLQYEPHLALFVEDNNPLLFYSKILEFSNNFLKPEGKVYFEINEKYGHDTVDLMKKYNFHEIIVIKDMQNKDRMVKGIKQN